MKRAKNPVSRREDVVVQELDGEVLIYDLRSNKAYCLNETSAHIWRACDGTRDVKALTSYVSKQLKGKASDDLIWLALDQFKKEKLIENAPDTSAQFAGMSRREVIRRIGVGSAVALPIIAGLAAPPAYAQLSVCGTTCICGPSGQTQGQPCNTTGSGSSPCPATPNPACTVCIADTSASNSPGTCFAA